jgi:hypothetical protein
MLIGITLVENWSYSSVLDTAPEADKTIFVLGAIDVMVRSFIADNATVWLQSDNGLQLMNKTAARNYELVRFGLKDVQNFKDAKGNDLKIVFVDRAVGGALYKVVSDDFLKMVPPQVIAELAGQIIEKNSTSADLVKK